MPSTQAEKEAREAEVNATLIAMREELDAIKAAQAIPAVHPADEQDQKLSIIELLRLNSAQ